MDLSQPRVMGVLNITPDSFSDGGEFLGREAAVAQARRMAEEGAAVIDVGGESTRPGAAPVTVSEELARIQPVIEAVRAALPQIPISVDTSKPEVMRAAVAAGADLINDVRALRHEGAVEAAAELDVPVCLMHMKGEPRTMQDSPSYEDVVAEVRDFLDQRIRACQAAGIHPERLLVDPGFGFGKGLAHNLALLRHLEALGALGKPVVVGLSRKSLIGTLTGRGVDERVYGSTAAAAIAVYNDAHLVRAHDVGATVDALAVAAAVRDVPGAGGD